MEHSSENIGDNLISEKVTPQRRFNKRVLIVVALIALVVGVSLAMAYSTSEKRVMAPGPIGSTDSISKPLA